MFIELIRASDPQFSQCSRDYGGQASTNAIKITITIKREDGKGDKLLDFPRSDSEKETMDIGKCS